MIELTLPDGSQVMGCLHEGHGREELDQDILFVKLPNGVAIDVGWYPQDDPSGLFRVRVIREENWDNPIEEFRSTDLGAVATKVETLADKYVNPPSSSDSTTAHASSRTWPQPDSV